MKLYPRVKISDFLVLYQEIQDQKLWHIYIPEHLSSKAQAVLYNLTYDNEKDCYADFCEMLLKLARKRMLNLRELHVLRSLMIDVLSRDTSEVDNLIAEMENEVKELEERFSWDNLSEREKQILDTYLDLQKKSGAGEDLRSLYREDESEPNEIQWDYFTWEF